MTSSVSSISASSPNNSQGQKKTHNPLSGASSVYATLMADFPQIYKLFAADRPEFSSRKEFSSLLMGYVRGLAFEQEMISDFHSLVAELSTLGEHTAVLCCIDTHAHLWKQTSFSHLLAEGAAAMVCGQNDRAELCLKKAHHQMPEESAPMVNLVKIFLDAGRLPEAEEWLDAGLMVHPNDSGFWNLYADLLVEGKLDRTQMFETIMEKAGSHKSWLGESLAWDYMLRLGEASNDPNHPSERDLYRKKAESLEAFYHQGVRDLDFLVEYSGALGASGEYSKIPPLVWQARHSSHSLPWKLELHGVQATLAMGQTQKGLELLNELLTSQSESLPAHHLTHLQDLKQELIRELAT